MTIPFWCLVVVIYMPFFLSWISARHRVEQFGSYDNNFSRAQGTSLTGKGALVWAAHNNALEQRAPFAAAVIVAHVSGADPTLSAWLAIAFIVIRIAHMIAHLTEFATARSALFGLSMACILCFFVLAAMT